MSKKNLHRTQFTFFASYFTAIEHLPKSRRYEALRAVICYALEGALPEDLAPSAQAVFDAIRPNLESGRVKAAARLAELSREGGDGGSDPPAGSDKKKNKKENENKNKYKNEREEENEEENEGDAAPAGEARTGAAFAEKALSSRAEGDELSELGRGDPKVGRAVDGFLRHWEKASRPLTPEERRLTAWALALHGPEEQARALWDAVLQDRRQVSFPASPSV